jgi:hypothetical protein
MNVSTSVTRYFAGARLGRIRQSWLRRLRSPSLPWTHQILKGHRSRGERSGTCGSHCYSWQPTLASYRCQNIHHGLDGGLLGRGIGVGRGLGVRRGLGVGVCLGVTVAVAVAVGVGGMLAVAVAVAVAVGVNVAVAVGVGV